MDPRSHVALIELDPNSGKPLGDPSIVPIDPLAADQDPSLFAFQSGRLGLFGFSWFPLPARRAERARAAGIGLVDLEGRANGPFVFWGGHVQLSDDDGRTWRARAPLPIVPGMPDLVPGRRPWFGGAVRGRAVETPEGETLVAAYAPEAGTGRMAAVLHMSTDQGETWSHRGVIARDAARAAGFVEPSLVRLGDGRLVAFLRTFNLDGRLATAVSEDAGRSWGAWTVHDVEGHPFDPCPLPDGRVLLVYGRREPPFGVRARVWDPRTRDIARAPEIVIRDDAPSADVGYPWAATTPDGGALVAHYTCDARGVRHIAGSRLSLS